MPVMRPEKLAAPLERLDAGLAAMSPPLGAAARTAIERWRADAAALRFHLRKTNLTVPMTVILGGTGTGKSTLVNRIVGATVTATSFRRTFTSGPVAIVRDVKLVPEGWLGVEHVIAQASDLPARGRADALIVVPLAAETASPAVLVDTPDLDGDQPVHHAQADRAFRWA
ncbi:MAG TPA: GTPase domain-containing protein, partial [Tepidisphaeraceae bacterium]|nr:GTPase domain-containing protein [Tepidisphaeraceae bacterium]